MKIIKLTQNKLCLVDDEDFDILNHFKWYADNHRRKAFYAARKGNNQISIYMHRAILNIIDKKIIVDHIDGNGLNNCKSNLRICTIAENARNRDMNKNNTSGVKGVTYDKRNCVYRPFININCKHVTLRSCKTLDEAIIIRIEAEKKYYGNFARIA